MLLDRVDPLQQAVSRSVTWLFWILCAALAAVSARPYAGSWSDGSRLAAIESIVDHHTLAFDDSIFVNVPLDAVARGIAPYRDPLCLAGGTCDKLCINGH